MGLLPTAASAQLDKEYGIQRSNIEKAQRAKQELHARCVDIWQRAQYFNNTGRIYVDNSGRVFFRNVANDIDEFYCGYIASIGKEVVLNDLLVPAPSCPPTLGVLHFASQ